MARSVGFPPPLVSASIDLLSGATYTSEAYAESLQSALDQVRT